MRAAPVFMGLVALVAVSAAAHTQERAGPPVPPAVHSGGFGQPAQHRRFRSATPRLPPPVETDSSTVGSVGPFESRIPPAPMPSESRGLTVGTTMAPRLCLTAAGSCAVGVGPANVDCWCGTSNGPVGSITQ
jgi:hypothetical protein